MQHLPPKPQRPPQLAGRAQALREKASRQRQIRLRRTMVLAGLLAVTLTLLLTVVLPPAVTSPIRQALSPGAAAPAAPVVPAQPEGLYGSPAGDAMDTEINDIIAANSGHRIGVSLIDPE